MTSPVAGVVFDGYGEAEPAQFKALGGKGLVIKRSHGLNAHNPEWARRLVERCRIADVPWCDHGWVMMTQSSPVEQARIHWRHATASGIVSTGMYNPDFERVSDQCPGMSARQILDWIVAYGDEMQQVSQRPVCWYMNLGVMQATGIADILRGTTLLSDHGHMLRRARWQQSIQPGAPDQWVEQYGATDPAWAEPLPGFASIVARQMNTSNNIRRALFGQGASAGACSINLADERMLRAA